MAAPARFDLKLDKDDKELFSEAASLMGTSMAGFVRLDSKIHNCAGFDCGTAELNDYLTRRATQDRRRNVSRVYVLIDTDEPTQVLGYYTLSAAQVDTDQISEQERRRLPRYPLPCFRMGRFAVQQDIQGQGLGKRLLGCA